MYDEFGKTGKGYTAADYRRLIEQVVVPTWATSSTASSTVPRTTSHI